LAKTPVKRKCEIPAVKKSSAAAGREMRFSRLDLFYTAATVR